MLITKKSIKFEDKDNMLLKITTEKSLILINNPSKLLLAAVLSVTLSDSEKGSPRIVFSSN